MVPDFDRYLYLKRRFNFIYKGLHLNRILTPEFIQITFGKDKFNLINYFDILKFAFRSLDVKNLRHAFLSKEIVVTNSQDRRDNLELISAFFSNVVNYTHVPVTSLKPKYSLFFKYENLIRSFSYVFLKFTGEETLKEKLYLAAHLTFYLNIYSSLRKEFKEVSLIGKKYVAYNSAYDVESLFTQFFNLNNVKTYHLSHGLSYINYKKQKPFDAVNGENINAQYILVWGQSSCDDLIKNYNISKDRIFVAGNPKYETREILIKDRLKRGIVFLGRSIYDESNIKLLEILSDVSKEHDFKFSVKIHPSSNIEYLRTQGDFSRLDFLADTLTIKETLGNDEFDFAISHNTTVYYEAMCYNLVSLRYSYNENEDYIGLDDKFEDGKSLLEWIKIFEKSGKSSTNSSMKSLLIEVLGMGINKYNSILNNEQY